jgi:CheY-like chemotaxis protein
MRGIEMSVSGWAFPTAAAAIVGFVLFGIYSNLATSYIDTTAKSANAKSAPKPIIPVLVAGDEGPSSVQQTSDASTAVSLPTPIQALSSEATKPPTDPWKSEGMEAALREPFAEELTMPDEAATKDEAARRDSLLDGAVSDRSSLLENSVPSKIEPLPSEDTTIYSDTPAQLSIDQYAKVTPQSVPTLGPPSDPPKATEGSSSTPTEASSVTDAPSSPSTDESSPQSIDHKAEKASDKMKRVLIVEDSRTHSETLAIMLGREPDLKVAGQTSSVAECRNLVSDGKGFDVSIVEPFLLDGQGTGLIEELRRSCPHVPMLVLARSLDPLDHERALKAGADAVLSKSANFDEIISTLRRL